MRTAATLLFLRDHEHALQVFMTQRNKQMAFAAGALVFPGGTVSKSDSTPALLAKCDQHTPLPNEDMTMRMAGIRESFEEAGLLLARKEGTLLTNTELDTLAEQRIALNKGELSFLAFLEDNKLRIATDLLQPFARWITPEWTPRQYDTMFYLVDTPEQQPSADNKEVINTHWLTPQDAITRADNGEFPIIFPTRMNLHRLNKAANTAEAFTQARQQPIVTVRPRIEEDQEGIRLCIPKHAGYDAIGNAVLT